jgi:DNA-binding transcriptional MocR family regulator
MKRYEQIAEHFSGHIRAGTLRAGDRMPSVRSVAASRRVSPATVVQAYQLLEDRGEIQVRSRSGHYVSARLRAAAPEPGISQPAKAPVSVDVRDLVYELLDAVKRRNLVHLGSAFPGAELYPLAKLARSLHTAAARIDPQTVYEQLSPGNADLRRQVARRYLEAGCDVPMDEIVITTGALEGLNLCLQSVTRPGDLVAIESPTFYAALEAIERAGLKAVEVPTAG